MWKNQLPPNYAPSLLRLFVARGGSTTMSSPHRTTRSQRVRSSVISCLLISPKSRKRLINKLLLSWNKFVEHVAQDVTNIPVDVCFFTLERNKELVPGVSYDSDKWVAMNIHCFVHQWMFHLIYGRHRVWTPLSSCRLLLWFYTSLILILMFVLSVV